MAVSYATELQTLKPAEVAKLDNARLVRGRLIECPTVAEVYRRHQQMKGWYTPRDILINDFMGMAQLESPFSKDQAGLELAGYVQPDGTAQFAIDSFPFETLTLAMSMVASKHPYVTVARSTKQQSEASSKEFEMFCQAILDQRMQQSNFVSEAMQKLMVTGWLCSFFPYDPGLKAQGEFPYHIYNLSPLGVYPAFDSRRKAMWVTVERKMTGAQLKQDYSHYPGVREFLDNDCPPPAGTDAWQDYSRTGNNFLTTEFSTIIYYDDAYSCVLINGNGVSQGAGQYNATLKAMGENRSQYRSLLTGSGNSTRENPYAGVVEHKLGRLPFDFTWCWPEARDITTSDYQSAWAGRYMGLPFLFGEYDNWRDMSKILSQLHTIMLAAAKAKLITTSEGTVDMSQALIQIEPGSDLKYVTPPPMPQEGLMLFRELKEKISHGTFNESAYGSSGGATSGNQQRAGVERGTIRINTITKEVERSLANSLRGITQIGMHRGEEELKTVGNGRKYGGKSYIAEYDMATLKAVPDFTVAMMEANGWKNPEAVAEFKSLVEVAPTRLLLRYVMDEPDPDLIMEMMREEAVEKEKSNMLPYVELGEVEARLKLAKKLFVAKQKLEDEEDAWELEKRKHETEREMSQLPEEVLAQKGEAALQQIMQMVKEQLAPPGSDQPPTTQPGQSQGQPPGMMPPGMQPPMMPPTGTPGMMMQGQPTPGGMPMIPPPMPPMMPAQGQPPPMPPMMPAQGQPPPMNQSAGPIGLGQVAKAPGQAQQPIQPLSRQGPPGGVGRPGVASPLVGAQGLPGQPTPGIAAANAAVAPIGPLQPPTLGSHRNARRRRGKRG